MDELPELPFEKVLSYLSLKDLLKSRIVSRGWCQRVDNYKVKSLCFSERPLGFIWGKSRWITGDHQFVQNFINSTKFDFFFNTFGRSILSNLRHLRLCDLELGEANGTAFAQTLNMFDQLEELGFFYFNLRSVRSCDPGIEFELNLPMLTSIQLEKMDGIDKLTLDSPRLRKVRVHHCSDLSLVIVHGELVEYLLVDRFGCTAEKNLKNLKILCTNYTGYPAIDPTFLSDMDQLKEIHVHYVEDVESLFEQKQRYGLTDLKIYIRGLLLNDPRNPAIDSLSPEFTEEALVQLAENPLADEIPYQDYLRYPAIERVDPEVAIGLVNRFTHLYFILVNRPVQDIDRFLDILKKFPKISELEFTCAQPQDLFDRLPDHSTIQHLIIRGSSPNLRFLSRMNHMISLELHCPIDAELIRRLFEDLPFLSHFNFIYNSKSYATETSQSFGLSHAKQFKVASSKDWEWTNLPDLEALIEFFKTVLQGEQLST